jgi:hypothetical protein
LSLLNSHERVRRRNLHRSQYRIILTTCLMIQVISNWLSITQPWPWSMIGVFMTLITWSITISVIVYYNRRPERRRRALRKLGTLYFIVPSSLHHDCGYAQQTDNEHWLKQIYVPAGRDIAIDFVLFPRTDMDTSQVYVGCDGKLNDKPLPFEICNRFVLVGPRRHVVPGQGNNNDYRDKHLFYHAVEIIQWSKGAPRALGFTFKTRASGSYKIQFYFIGEADRGELTDLIMYVTDTYAGKLMRCYNPKHKRCTVAAYWDS